MWPTGDAIAPPSSDRHRRRTRGKLLSDGPASARPTASARLCADSVPGGTTATMPRSARACGAVGLLGLAIGGEGHQHGAVGAAQGLDHGVVAGLGDRERGVAKQRREVGTRRFDDDAFLAGERGPVLCRQVLAQQQSPGAVGQRRLRPRGDGGLEQRRADGAAAHRDDDLILAFGALHPLRQIALRDIAGVEGALLDARPAGEASLERYEAGVAVDQHGIEQPLAGSARSRRPFRAWRGAPRRAPSRRSRAASASRARPPEAAAIRSAAACGRRGTAR